MNSPSIIPRPAKMELTGGEFVLKPESGIAFKGAAAYGVAARLAQCFRKSTGFSLPVVPADMPGDHAISLTISGDRQDLGDEGYRLVLSRSRITLTAAADAGLFHAVQTLRQLFDPAIDSPHKVDMRWTAPCLEIEDTPRFKWRGLMLDEGRHWYGKDFVKTFIETMALHKYNVLHWHLTENAGWRIEIKKYPRLQEVGAWRARTVIGRPQDQQWPYQYEEKPYGGFYTQDEVGEIVAYAAQHHITVVPEIDLPAHCQAALASYPELGCTGGPYDVMTYWGYSYNDFCAGNEQVFTFLQDVFDEIIGLFPSPYIHLGGDECKKRAWDACPKCRQRMADEKLADLDQLQSYFVNRIGRHIVSRGRTPIGWDEILEGGAVPGAAVMVWLEKGASYEEAARLGHPVVAALHHQTYFDYYQGNPAEEPLAIGGYLPLSKVYAFDPAPATFAPEISRWIMGVQGQIWSQYIKTPAQVEYMTFPRAAALAEVAWTAPEFKDYDHFFARLEPHLRRLEYLGVNFRRPEPPGKEWSPDAKPAVGA